MRHGCLPALCLYWLRFGFFKMEESYEKNVSDNGLENGFFTVALPAWMIVVFVAVIIAAGVIAWVVAH